MTKETLEKWRHRAPLVIVVAFATPYFLVVTNSLQDLKAISDILVSLGALAVAALYVGLNWRSTHWKAELRKQMGPQIQEALLNLLPPDLEVTPEERAILARQDVYKSLTGVFWEAVDSDDALKAHKEHFYANGAIYTTAIDVYILGACASVCYEVAYVVTGRTPMMVIAAILLAFALLSRYSVVVKCRKRHLQLSAEQLDLLRRNQKDFVQKRFRELVLARRRDGLLN